MHFSQHTNCAAALQGDFVAGHDLPSSTRLDLSIDLHSPLSNNCFGLSPRDHQVRPLQQRPQRKVRRVNIHVPFT